MNENNIVQPVNKRTEESGANPNLITALRVSGTKKSSKYNLSKTDRENGFYFIYGGIEVPFRVLLNENQKTSGIVGIAFGTAKDCPSQALGLCQLPDDALCYARAGEKRATRRDNENGEKGMDSYYNGLLCSAFWDAFETSAEVRDSFEAFLIALNVKTIRFNLKSDFRHGGDILAVEYLANCGFNLTGYTARDDLAPLLDKLGKNPRVILNGSNRKYTNRFKATANIEEFLTAKYTCRGSCSACGNCYRLRGVTITVLIHGSGSDTELNNEANRDYIACLVEDIGYYMEDEDFETAKGLNTCINKFFKRISNIQFENIKEALKFLRNQHYYYTAGIGYGWALYDPNGFEILFSEDFEDIEDYANRKGFKTIWGEI